MGSEAHIKRRTADDRVDFRAAAARVGRIKSRAGRVACRSDEIGEERVERSARLAIDDDYAAPNDVRMLVFAGIRANPIYARAQCLSKS